jgi:N-acetyl-anhydromuramyl-L-alanine amidase AmpD
VRALVLHTTGGIRPPLGVYETLRARGLSVHWVVGVDGECVQMAPHHLVCLHAGAVNAWTVGIEFVSPLLARTSVAEMERKRGVHREVYRDRVRGRRVLELLDMTEAQTRAGLVLVEQLCDVLELPRRVPTESGELMRRQMTPGELESFEGVMGHYHAHGSKLDPGTRFLDQLRERW